MADTIDTLELKIQSDSKSASDGLDRLVSSLLGLDKASKRGVSGLGKFSDDVRSFANAAKMLNKVKMPDMSVFNIQGDFNGLQNLSQGITALANSVQTLSGVKISQISQAGTRLERLGRIDLSGFANAVRPLSGMDFSGLVNLGSSFRQFTDSMAGAERVTAGTQKIFSSLAQLAASAGNIPIIQQALPSLTTEIQRFISGMAQAPAVESGTVSIVSALSGIATSGTRAEKAATALPSLTKAITDFADALARAPALNNNVVNAIQSLSQFASTGGKAGAAARSLQSNITRLSGSMGGLRSGVSKGVISIKNLTRSLLSAAGIAGGLYGVFRGLRKAINISSDLTEVQNVVDVTFGDMAEKIDKLAETSIQDFGLSELTLKQISSRFQAMGVAMGFGQEKMSDMSIELTKLAADMASFYNVEQEDVAESLQAIFTGQTRPLRRFGIDLTEATLQEWALKNGLDADIKSMTQAEKAMLRYQYVMEASNAAQGDFARTSGTWANQLRILIQNFQALGSVVGGVLINAFKPLISTLNSVMQSVIAFAETVANALGVIFGWTIRIDSGGLANDFEAAGAGAAAMEDGTGGAADNAKKMSKYIAAWQEVNNMTTPDDEEGSGGGGGGGVGDGAAEGAEANLVKMETIFDKYKSEIDSLYELGEYIGDTLTRAMQDIKWDDVYESARNFGSGLADFLNGLISPELFGEVGTTIAGALNTAIYAALSFGETFEWAEFGESIATGINNFFETFNFGALANTLNTWIDGLEDTIKGFLDTLDWSKILSGIGDFLQNLDADTIAAFIGIATLKTFGGKIASAIKTHIGTMQIMGIGLEFAGFLTTVNGTGKLKETLMASIEAGLGTLLLTKDIKVSLILAAITFGVGEAVNLGNWLSKKVTEILLGDSVDTSEVWELPDLSLKQAVKLLISPKTPEMEEGEEKFRILVTGWLYEKGAAWRWLIPIANLEFDMLFNPGSVWQKIQEYVTPAFDPKAWYAMFETIKTMLKKRWDEAVEQWKTDISDWWDNHVAKWFDIKKWYALYETIKSQLKKRWDETSSQWKTGISEWWNNDVTSWFTVKRWLAVYAAIKTALKNKWDETSAQWKTNIQNWWNNDVTSWFTAEKWTSALSGIKTGFENAFNAAIGAVKEIWNKFAEWLNEKLSFEIPSIGSFGGQKITLGKLPTFAAGGVVDKSTLAIIGEAGKEAVVPLEKNAQWISNVASQLSKELGRFKLDLSIPDLDFTPKMKTSDMGKFQSTMQMEMDARMAEYEFEMQQMRESNERVVEVLERIEAKGIVLDDNTFERKYKSSANAYRRRTGSQLGVAY